MAELLIVDDDEPIRRMLARTLSAEGYGVRAAADDGAALAAVERSMPDLLILDVAMPGVDGLGVARRLRAKRLSLPILFLTARDSVADRVGGFDAGADDYLVKPFAMEELLVRVRALLRRGRPVEESSVYRDLRLDATLDTVPAVALCGGAAVYLFGHVAFLYRSTGRIWRRRSYGTIALVALLPVALAIPALAALGLVTAVCTFVVAYEVIGRREHRSQVRAQQLSQ